MKEFLLLLPVIFIIHDMEEIVGFGCFFGKNPWVYKKYPRITKTYHNFKTDIFALSVNPLPVVNMLWLAVPRFCQKQLPMECPLLLII